MLDLHIHTNNSDGQDTTLEILKKAEELKLQYISITDHNVITAYKDLKNINIKDYYTGEIINGVELEFKYNGIIMDMLGYNIDISKIEETEPVKRWKDFDFLQVQKDILKQYKKICDNLNIKYDSNLEVTNPNYKANDALYDNMIIFPENNDILNQMKAFDRTTFYRNCCCNSNSEFFIDRTIDAMTINQVVDAIHCAGGKAILAHMFVYGFENPEEVLEEIINLNIIDGIEVAHRKHTLEQTEYLLNRCNELNLLYSCGSDFHMDKNRLGYVNEGRIQLNYEFVSKELLKL